MGGASSTRLAFREHRRRSLNIIKNSIYYLNHYYSYPPPRPGNIWLDNNWHNPNRLCNKSSCYSENHLFRWKKLLNPHLPRRFSFVQTQEYRLPGVEVLEHQRTTIQGVGRGVVAHRGSIIFQYEGEGLWRRFDLANSCLTVQEVES